MLGHSGGEGIGGGRKEGRTVEGREGRECSADMLVGMGEVCGCVGRGPEGPGGLNVCGFANFRGQNQRLLTETQTSVVC